MVSAPAGESRGGIPVHSLLNPVRGMTVAGAADTIMVERDGDLVGFCCAGCRDRYLASPERFGTA